MSEQLSLLDQTPAPLPELQNAESLLALLDAWVEQGWLRALDRALAGFCLELDGESAPLLLLSAALVSHQLGHGHVCLDLAVTLASPDFALSLPPEGDEGSRARLPSELLASVELADWRAALAGSALVATGRDDGCEAPLVLHGERLYLRRYWNYERAVAMAIGMRLDDTQTVPVDLSQALQRLFPEPPVIDGQRQIDWQKLACALAARGSFSLIT
ncbi:MAG TPA: exodeoxyribonuclease V subunit alpha, partial [Pseudomonas sp.]|nr:exodeoxyribonuclease V subunit alpha [Pseudomonas sp.]